MRNLLVKISIFLVLLSSVAEAAVSVFSERETVVLIIADDDNSGKKEEEENKCKEEIKDKILFSHLFESVTEIAPKKNLFRNIYIKTSSHKSLPEMPPDLV